MKIEMYQKITLKIEIKRPAALKNWFEIEKYQRVLIDIETYQRVLIDIEKFRPQNIKN